MRRPLVTEPVSNMIRPSSAGEVLPPLYSGWMAEVLPGPIPKESRATCDDCAMCSHAEDPDDQTKYFDPGIKCCTYIPELHNFLAGRILSDDDPVAQAGRSTVENRISAGIAVNPLGLGHPPVFSLLYENNTNAFGRSRTLRCPHYMDEGGRCGIWRNRESTCATWFCKHVRGDVGFTFWRNSLHQLLMVVERALARWSVLELDIGEPALRHLVATASWRCQADQVTSEAMDNRVDRDSYAKLWGKWLGREEQFFVECAQLVNDLSWEDVLSIAGPEARAYAALTRDVYRRLTSDELPTALIVGSVQLIRLTRNATRVCTYSPFDPLELPNVMMESLHHFDGRPTEEAIGSIAAEKGIVMDMELVRKMVDFALLVPSQSGRQESLRSASVKRR